VMRIFIKVRDGVIVDAKFLTYGCVAAIAATDALCDLIKGKTLEEAEAITAKNVTDELGGVPLVKYHCSIMGGKALKNAIKNYKEKTKLI
ncbi:MAG: iron-sulfur cluster assembly scaffold protein, partial [Candidatus Firestonebacteria bacterium]